MVLAAFVCGCASTSDLKKLSGQVQDNAIQTDQRLKKQQENIDRLSESTASLHKSQADVGVEMMSLKDYLQEMQGLSDKQRKDIAARLNRKDEEIKELKEKQDRLILRIGFLETYLGLADKDNRNEGGEKGKTANGSGKDVPKLFSDKDQAYAAAYDLFKEGSYDKARAQFQDFLKNFPNTEYSDNAQFWIGSALFRREFRAGDSGVRQGDEELSQRRQGGAGPFEAGSFVVNMGDKVSGRLNPSAGHQEFPQYQSGACRTFQTAGIEVRPPGRIRVSFSLLFSDDGEQGFFIWKFNEGRPARRVSIPSSDRNTLSRAGKVE